MLAELHPFGFGPWLLEHPKDILATLVGLALLLLLLYRFAIPGAKSLLSTRATLIETGIVQVDRQLSDVAQLRNDYSNRIATIEKEQRDRIAAAVRDADNARAEIIAEADETARAVRRRGEEEMERERTRQRILMRQQIVQITLNAAEEAVRMQNSDAVQRQLIRDFIGEVAKSGSQNGSTVAVSPPSATPQIVTAAPAASATTQPSAPIVAAAPLSEVPQGAVSYASPTAAPVVTQDAATESAADFMTFNPPVGQGEA